MVSDIDSNNSTIIGRQMVRQLILNPAQEIELRSYNPIHPPIYINKADISAMYRVVFIQPQLKRT